MTLEPAKDFTPASPVLDMNSRVRGVFNYTFDVTTCLLGCLSAVAGFDYWRNLLAFNDRILCFGLVIFGLSVALARSKWRGNQTQFRVWFSTLLYSMTVILSCLAVVFSNPIWAGLALSTLVAGWSMVKLRGESLWQSLFFGLALSIPLWIDFLANRGLFDALESNVIGATSQLATAAGQPNVTADRYILFQYGTADDFAAIGVWDSTVCLLGVSLCCVLVFRRRLLTSCATIGLAALVWIAVRTVGWVTLVYLASRNETWYAWSFGIQCGLFLIEVLLIYSLDQFFANIFRPIPFKYFHPESPRWAFIWNWLCGLPNVVLRLPKQNVIAIRWSKRVKLAGKRPSFRTDLKWMLAGFREMLLHPVVALAGMIFACRGWKWSRNWPLFFLHFPSVVLLVVSYSILGLSWSNRKDCTAQFLTAESQRLCSTTALEIACQQKQEEEFSKTIGAAAVVIEDAFQPIQDSDMRFIRLLSERVLSIEPTNSIAKYRLAMVWFLSDQKERAEREMRQIVESELVSLPPANAWLAKEMIIHQGAQEEISRQELVTHLEKARKWKEVDFRLLFLYVRILEEQGDYNQAVEVAKELIDTKPEFKLHLAKLYARLGDNERRISAAMQAERYFLSKIGTSSETESDRLSVANSRLLSNQPEQAAEILSEGLSQHRGGEQTTKLLSEIQRMLYAKSIRKNDSGKFELDLRLLEKMVEIDALNPNVSTEIAKLIDYEVVPTEKLKDAITNQIANGNSSASSLIMIGEAYFRKGKYGDAQRYWEKAIAKEPDNFEGLNNLAVCLIAISESNADRAIELVSKANSVSPNNADILDTWGEALLAAKRPHEAVNKLEMAIRRDRNRIDTRKKLIAAYETLGMKEMAEKQAEVIHSLEKKTRTNK